MAVPAGYHQTKKRRFQLRMSDVVGGNVPPNVVNRNQRLLSGQHQAFGKIDPHQKRSDQPWGIGDRNTVNLLQANRSVVQRFLGYGDEDVYKRQHPDPY